MVHAAVLESTTARQRSELRRAALSIELRFYLELVTRDDEVRLWDVSSHQKLTVDAVCEAVGRDDKYVLDLRLTKAQRRVANQVQIEIATLPVPRRG